MKLDSSDGKRVTTFRDATGDVEPTLTGDVTISEGANISLTQSGQDVAVAVTGAVLNSEVDADIKTLTLPASTTISAFGATLVDDADAPAARTTLGVDAAGTDNSTDVTLAGTPDYITISGQVITRNTIVATTDLSATGTKDSTTFLRGDDTWAVPAGGGSTFISLTDVDEPDYTGHAGQLVRVNATPDGLEFVAEVPTANIADSAVTLAKMADIATDSFIGRDTAATGVPEVLSAATARAILNVADGADVTGTANVTSAGALMDSEVDADLKTLVLPANTTISAFGATLVDDADAATARTTLGVDAAGTDNSTDVTLAGTPDYITISGQVITRNTIVATTDLSATGTKDGTTFLRGDDTWAVPAGGASTFTGLTDVGEADYVGHAGDLVRVNATPNGLEFVAEIPTASIADSAVTLAKMADIATDSFIGRDTAATGVPEVLSAATARAILNVEDGADVTDVTNVTSAGALMDSEVDADLKTFALPANTTISAFGATVVDDIDAATARTTLGVDAAGTDNSTDVTLAGTPDYITISGQVITRNTIVATTDLSATGTKDATTYLRGDDTWATIAGGGDVTAAAVMANNTIVRGDGGAKGVQDSGITIDDTDNLSGANSIHLADNKELQLGTLAGGDATIAWDGTNLVIDSGAGSVDFTSANDIKLGDNSEIQLGDLAGGDAQIKWTGTLFRIDSTASIVMGGSVTFDEDIFWTTAAVGSWSADVDNFDPTGVADVPIQRVTSSTAVTVSGIIAPAAPGKMIGFNNIGSNDITFSHEDTGSTAFRRFDLPGGANITIAADETVIFYYDSALKWKLFSLALEPSAGGGGTGGDKIDLSTSTAGPRNTTSETTLYSFSLPGGKLSTDQGVKIHLAGKALNNPGSARYFEFKIKYGATTMITTAQQDFANDTAGVNWTMDVVLLADAATNAQKASVAIMAVGDEIAAKVENITGYGTAAIDSTSAQNVVITARCEIANAACWWEKEMAYAVEIS